MRYNTPVRDIDGMARSCYQEIIGYLRVSPQLQFPSVYAESLSLKRHFLFFQGQSPPSSSTNITLFPFVEYNITLYNPVNLGVHLLKILRVFSGCESNCNLSPGSEDRCDNQSVLIQSLKMHFSLGLPVRSCSLMKA